MSKKNIICDFCGNKFERAESRLKRSKRYYCSRECVDQHKKEVMKAEGNHRYGTKASQETIKKMQDIGKEHWKDADYVEKILSSRSKTRKLADYPFGWDQKSREKRIDTCMRIFGAAHNWSNKECREKCEQTTLAKHGKSTLELANDKITKEVIEKRRKSLIETMTGVSYVEYEKKLTHRAAYYKKVRRITNQQDIRSLEHYECRGVGGEGSYHLDHIIPICYGWLNDIPEEIIGNISNLRFIPTYDNLKKSSYYEGKLWRADDEKI